MKHNCAALIKAIDAYLRKANDNLKDELESAGFAESEATVEDANDLEGDLVEILKAETDYVRDKLDCAIDLDAFANEWPDIKAKDTTDKEIEKIFLEEFKTQMPKLAKAYIKRIDSELTVSEISKRTTNWVKSWSAKLGEKMKLATHNEIERLLIKHLDEGKSVADLTRAFIDSGIRDERFRARRVAITEMLRAHSVAQQEAIVQSPAVSHKEWVHTGDYRNEPRLNHAELYPKVVPKNQPFTLKGADKEIHYPMYPRDAILPPGESVNCHCIHRGIVEERVLGLPLEERRRLQQEAINEDNGAWEKELDARNKTKAGIVRTARQMDADSANATIEIGKPVQAADVDFIDKRAIMEALETAESQFASLPYEADCTVTSDGKVWLTKGDSATVDPNAIPSPLQGCYSYHNHPKNNTNFSFSSEDIAFFLATESEYFAASDHKYRYSLQRTTDTLKAEYDDVVSEFKKVRDNEILPLAFDGEIDIDEDGYHVTIQKLSKTYHVKYERRKNSR